MNGLCLQNLQQSTGFAAHCTIVLLYANREGDEVESKKPGIPARLSIIFSRVRRQSRTDNALFYWFPTLRTAGGDTKIALIFSVTSHFC
jgi:hypothetical protein